MFKFTFLLLLFTITVRTGSGLPLQPQEAELPFQRVCEKISQKKEWRSVGEPLLLMGRDLLEVGTDIAEYLAEYRIQVGYRHNFLKIKDSLVLRLMVYQAASQPQAFGLYSIEKSPSEYFFDVGFESYRSGSRFYTWYGDLVIICESADTVAALQESDKNLVREIVRALPERKRNTPVMDALPDRNRVAHSAKFYAHRWLDQDYFDNIYYADYYTSQGYSRIFIINSHSTATADSNFWRYYTFMRDNGAVVYDSLRITTDFYVVDEPIWGKTLLAKKNQIIYGILDFRNREWTEDRLEEILNSLKKKKVVKSG
ncbi:MAG: DUF6599 family protein [Calditrichia bacterium]